MKRVVFVAIFLHATFFVRAQQNEFYRKIVANDASQYEYFGQTVDISGNFAIVGISKDSEFGSNSGAAYIFYNDGESWQQYAKLTPDDAYPEQGFGASVSISGNYAIIGVPNDSDFGTNSGAAYIFYYNGISWQQQAKIYANDAHEGDHFGLPVSMSGNFVAISSVHDDDNGTSSGSVYVFYKTTEYWQQINKLIAFDGSAMDFFGTEVYLFNDKIIISSPGDGVYPDKGSAYIYHNSNGNWEFNTKLTSNEGSVFHAYALSVSISDNYAVVGAFDPNDFGIYTGMAYVYFFDGNSWQLNTILYAAKTDIEDGLQINTAIVDDYIAIGLPYDNKGYMINTGSVYVFQNIDDEWTNINILRTYDANASDWFGSSVSMCENNIIVGAPLDDDYGSESGSAYICIPNIPNIATNPDNVMTCEGGLAIFSIEAFFFDDYQWQESVDGGFTFNNIDEDSIYSGTKTRNLLINPGITFNNNLYRCVASDGLYCETSLPGMLFIYEDYMNPIINSFQEDQVVDADMNCEASLLDYTCNVIATDDCDNELDVTQIPSPGTIISQGTNTITITVMDNAGNTDEISFNVSVEDNSDPVITSTHNDQIINPDTYCEAILPDYAPALTALDNCDNELDITQNPTPGMIISGDTNTVTFTVTDDAGNTDEVSFDVRVIDNMQPSIICVENQTVTADESNTYTVFGTEFDPVEISDNCEILSVTNDFNNLGSLAGEILQTGSNTIVWAVTDISGNTNQCSFDVIVSPYLGIGSLLTENILIKPNPTNGIFTVSSKSYIINEIIVKDITDKTLITKSGKTMEFIIDIKDFMSGSYFIYITTDEGLITKKVIKH